MLINPSITPRNSLKGDRVVFGLKNGKEIIFFFIEGEWKELFTPYVVAEDKGEGRSDQRGCFGIAYMNKLKNRSILRLYYDQIAFIDAMTVEYEGTNMLGYFPDADIYNYAMKQPKPVRAFLLSDRI